MALQLSLILFGLIPSCLCLLSEYKAVLVSGDDLTDFLPRGNVTSPLCARMDGVSLDSVMKQKEYLPILHPSNNGVSSYQPAEHIKNELKFLMSPECDLGRSIRAKPMDNGLGSTMMSVVKVHLGANLRDILDLDQNFVSLLFTLFPRGIAWKPQATSHFGKGRIVLGSGSVFSRTFHSMSMHTAILLRTANPLFAKKMTS